jgi:hypothetical protein
VGVADRYMERGVPGSSGSKLTIARVHRVEILGPGNHERPYLPAKGYELSTDHGPRPTAHGPRPYTTAFRAITSRYHSALSFGVRRSVL